MEYNVNFPHLGIFLPHVGKTLKIGSFSVAYYGICIALGMVLGIRVLVLRAEATGQKADDYFDISVITMVMAIIGARIYYVLFAWDLYREQPLSVFNIREGGLAIYGGLIGGVLTIWFLSKRKGIPFRRILDTCIIGVPIGQILGRWGNFFNREAFGTYTDHLLAMQLPVSAVRRNEITQAMWDHVVVREGVRYIQVHPTFLYEGLWNCLVLLILWQRRNRTAFEGELFLTYTLWYGVGRFFIEMLRTDHLLLPGTDVPVSMVVSAVTVLASAFLLGRGHLRTGRTQKR